MRTTEYSHNGVDWYHTASPNWQFRREIDDLKQNSPRDDIELWLASHLGSHIEYSTDGGFSYVPFRSGEYKADAGRIFTMQKMHYIVRSVKVEEVTRIMGSNFGFSQPAQFKQNRPRMLQKINYIFRLENQVWFSQDAKDAEGTHAQYISMVTQHIPMTMAERNQNEISTGYSVTDPIIRGHVYSILEINDPSTMDQAIVSYFEAQTVNKITEYALVSSPRSYDEESQEALNVWACAVLGSRDKKYYVHSHNNPFKIGDTFFVKKNSLHEMQRNLSEYGAYHFYDNVKVEADRTGEVIESIMKLDTKLEEALEGDDATALATALFEAMELRNQTVDAITKLNQTIQKAREKALTMVANSRPSNS